MNDPTLLQRAARYVALESGVQSSAGPSPISESRYIAAMRRVQGRVERRLLEMEVTREEQHLNRQPRDKASAHSHTAKQKLSSTEKAPFVTKF